MSIINQEFKSQIELALSVALQDPNSFKQAAKMYKQMFRSEPYPAAELLAMLQEEWDEASEIERKWDLLPPAEMFKSITDYNYDERLMICDLCNYKGEGEGYPVVFDESVSNLPVFRSKNDSMSMF